MKAVIVAAGRGSRLEPYTADRPKCALEFAGRRLIDWQESALAKAGHGKPELVLGYCADVLDDGAHTVWRNPRWQSTNMMYSFLQAKQTLLSGEPVLLVYGDILFEPRIVRAVHDASGDIRVVVDLQWRRYWEARVDDPLSDAESLRMDAAGRLLDIGRKVTRYEEIEAQYIGMVYFSAVGCRRLVEFMDRAREGDDWLMGRRVEMCYVTDVLRGMIQAGQEIRTVPTSNGWIEFDTVRDYKLYNEGLVDGSLSRFIDLTW